MRQALRPRASLRMRRRLSIALILVIGTLLSSPLAAQVRVTSLSGELSADGRPLRLHATLPAGQIVELAPEGHATLLLADSAVVHLTGGAEASFAEAGERGPGLVELRKGNLHAFVLRKSESYPLTVHTPAASIEFLGRELSVDAGPDRTRVRSLDGESRVSRRQGGEVESRAVKRGQQLLVARGQALGEPEAFARSDESDAVSSLARARSAEASSGALFAYAARPSDSAEDASEFASDLSQIVSADIPVAGVPLDEASSPSALITLLGKAGLDEEVCDPITCNPAFELPPPPLCDPDIEICP